MAQCNNVGVGIPYILGASNIENNTFYVERWIENPQVVSLKGDILLSVKGTIGKIYEQKEDKINISRQIMALRANKGIDNQYIYLYLKVVCDELREAGNGLIPGISREDILSKEIPLAPLEEQKRIVEQIESLFSKLDAAKHIVEDVVGSGGTKIIGKIDLMKKAILAKAFRGELGTNIPEEESSIELLKDILSKID